MDACAGTLSVAKAFALLPRHRRFAECLVDLSCVTRAILQCILIFASRLLSKWSYIDGAELVYTSANIQVKTEEAREVRKHLNVLEVPEIYPPMQTFQPCILYHLGTYFSETVLSKMERRVPASQRGRKRRA